MNGDDGIGALLPKPPPPAAARRRAAIDEALRRFDGAPETRQESSNSGRRGWIARPQAAAFATLAIVALIGVPVALTSIRQHEVAEVAGPSRQPAVRYAPAAQDASSDALASNDVAESDVAPAPASEAAARAAAPPLLRKPTEQPSVQAKVAPSASAPQQYAEAAAPPAAAVEARRVAEAAPLAAAPARLRDMADVVVTGIRSSLGNAAERGDWNACTVDDPSRNLTACRAQVDPSAKGAKGRAAAHVADGLSHAWRGEGARAINAFDEAIAAAPKSSLAYLNRGLMYRRAGQREKALADLDRAVRLAPKSARARYVRSLILRESGHEEKARSDEERALELDPSYAAVVNPAR